MRIAALACCIVVGGVASADPALDLQQGGEELAKGGRYSQAIAAFKAADRIQISASHACLIALAYTRRELWPQAEIFLALCHKRATPADPLPDWVSAADAQLVDRLQAAEVAPITIEVEPHAASAQVTVSSFAPDEIFEPRTVHLTFGTHTFTVRADGYVTQQRTITVVDRHPQTIAIALQTRPTPSHLGEIVLATGGAITLGAIAFQAFAFQPIRDQLLHAADTNNAAEYHQYSHAFDVRRDWMVGLYGIGLATAITGLVLHLTNRAAAAEIEPTPGGVVIGIAWQR